MTYEIKTNLDDKDNANVKFSGNVPNGLALDEDGTITIEDSPKATKGDSKEITVTNYGTSVKGKVKFIINDPAPEFEDVEDISITASKTKKATKTANVSLTEETCTGTTKIKWAISSKPSKGTVKIKGNGKTAAITVALPKGVYNTNKKDASDIQTSFTVTATNVSTKAVTAKQISLNITPCVDDDTSLPENETSETNSQATQQKSVIKFEEGVLVLNESQSAEHRLTKIPDNYKVIAELPEISVDVSGMYDFEIEVDEDLISTDEELIWFANSESGSEDDDIAEFYNSEGEEITTIPADRKLIISAWLNKDVKYLPIIAIRSQK